MNRQEKIDEILKGYDDPEKAAFILVYLLKESIMLPKQLELDEVALLEKFFGEGWFDVLGFDGTQEKPHWSIE